MSLWSCKEHGMVGGNPCCSQAARVEVFNEFRHYGDEVLKARIAALEAQVESLQNRWASRPLSSEDQRMALRQYGTHLTHPKLCAAINFWPDERGPCDCGLDAAIGSSVETPVQPRGELTQCDGEDSYE